MANLVIDTHTGIWYFANAPEISALAVQAIDDAVANGDTVFLSAISIVEIIYLIALVSGYKSNRFNCLENSTSDSCN